MKKDPAIKLQLASDYASIANYWKFFDGESKQLLKYNVYDQKKERRRKLPTIGPKAKPEFPEHFLSDWGNSLRQTGVHTPNTGCTSMKAFLDRPC